MRSGALCDIILSVCDDMITVISDIIIIVICDIILPLCDVIITVVLITPYLTVICHFILLIQLWPIYSCRQKKRNSKNVFIVIMTLGMNILNI